jgi:hypothetical protein
MAGLSCDRHFDRTRASTRVDAALPFAQTQRHRFCGAPSAAQRSHSSRAIVLAEHERTSAKATKQRPRATRGTPRVSRDNGDSGEQDRLVLIKPLDVLLPPAAATTGSAVWVSAAVSLVVTGLMPGAIRFFHSDWLASREAARDFQYELRNELHALIGAFDGRLHRNPGGALLCGLRLRRNRPLEAGR